MDYYAESGNRHREFLSAVSFGLAIVAFLVFATGLRELLARAAGEQSLLPNLAFVGGLAFALLWSVGWAAETAMTATLEFTDEFEIDPDTARLIRHFGSWWLPSFAAMTASLLVGATSLVARRSRLPAWLSWAGFVITIVLLFSLPVQFFGALAVALWVLATSILLVLRRAKPELSAT